MAARVFPAEQSFALQDLLRKYGPRPGDSYRNLDETFFRPRAVSVKRSL